MRVMRAAAAGRYLLAAVAAAGLLLAGCSSPSSSPGPDASQQQSFARYPTAPALLAQCAISGGAPAVLGSAEQYNATHPQGMRWLAGTRIELTGANGSNFTDWFENAGGAAVILGGQQLGSWQEWAADHDTLPAKVCGTVIAGAAVRHLYAQIYARWSAMANNDPW